MFFLFILIFVVILGFAVYTSKVGVEIKNLKVDTEMPKGKKINEDSEINIYFLIFNKLKLFKKNVREIDTHRIRIENKDIDIELLKQKNIKVDYKTLVRELNIYFEKIDLNVQIATDDAALTAILTGIISSTLGILIKKPKYEVIPVYANKNFLKIKLDCIFSIHLMQYIYKIVFNKSKELGKESGGIV